MRKILVIAYYFPPMVNAGVYRVLGFIKQLPSFGFLPIVLAGPPPAHPSQAGLLLQKAIPESVEVFYLGKSFRENSTKIRQRAERWFGLRKSSFVHWNESVIKFARKNIGSIEAVFVTMSPFESSYLAQKLSQVFDVPWVADLRDPWALDEVIVYPTALHRLIEKIKMKQVLSSASVIIMNTPEAAKRIRNELFRDSNKKIFAITNGYDEEDFPHNITEPVNSKLRIVHSGGFLTEAGLSLKSKVISRALGGRIKGVDLLTRSPYPLLQAVNRICEDDAKAKKKIEVIFSGRLSAKDKKLIQSFKYPEMITLLGQVPHSKNVKLLCSAELLYLPMHYLPGEQRATSIPGKLYEYLASCRPILACVPNGDARDFLMKSGAALICDSGDVTRMAQILKRCYSEWRRYGHIRISPNKEFISQFGRRRIARRLALVLRKVLDGQ